MKGEFKETRAMRLAQKGCKDCGSLWRTVEVRTYRRKGGMFETVLKHTRMWCYICRAVPKGVRRKLVTRVLMIRKAA